MEEKMAETRSSQNEIVEMGIKIHSLTDVPYTSFMTGS